MLWAILLIIVVIGVTIVLALRQMQNSQQQATSGRPRGDYFSRRVHDLERLTSLAKPLTSRFVWADREDSTDEYYSRTESYAGLDGIKLNLNGDIFWIPKERQFLKRISRYEDRSDVRYSYSPVSLYTLSEELRTEIASGIAKHLINSMCPGLLTNPRVHWRHFEQGMRDELAGLARKLTDVDLEILADVAASDPDEDVRQDATALLDAHAQQIVGREPR